MTNPGFKIDYAQTEALIQEMNNILWDLTGPVLAETNNIGIAGSSGETYEALEALSKELNETREVLKDLIEKTIVYVKDASGYFKDKDTQYSAGTVGIK